MSVNEARFRDLRHDLLGDVVAVKGYVDALADLWDQLEEDKKRHFVARSRENLESLIKTLRDLRYEDSDRALVLHEEAHLAS
jgi:hypothetical protein